MLKNIHCVNCDRKQNMVEKDGDYICSVCGTKHNLQYIDSATHQIDIRHSIQAINGIAVVQAIVCSLCDHIEELSEMDLRNLLFFRKVAQWAVDMEPGIENLSIKKETGETISFKLPEESARIHELRQKMALVDAELSNYYRVLL